MSILISVFVFIAIITFSRAFYLFLNEHKPRQVQKVKRNSNVIIFSFLLLSISSVFLALSLEHIIHFIGNKTNYTNIGAYGDLIGGIMNPVVAFIGIIAASLAFYVQYKANLQVQKQFEKQNQDQLFFRLMDSTDKRISNHLLEIDIGPHHNPYVGYQIMQGYVKELRFNMDIQCLKYIRTLLSKQPELLDIEYYQRIIEAMKVSNRLAPYANGKELKEALINRSEGDREYLLESLLGYFKKEPYAIEVELKEIAGIHFYKTPYKNRYSMYATSFEKLYEMDGVFLEGYFNNLRYILSYLDKIGENTNAFYIEYLIESLSSYEKVLLLYYFTSYNATEEFKSIVKKYGILNDLVNHRSYFTDLPSVAEFKKELADVLNFRVPR